MIDTIGWGQAEILAYLQQRTFATICPPLIAYFGQGRI